MTVLCDWEIKSLCYGGAMEDWSEGLINPASLDVRLGSGLMIEVAGQKDLLHAVQAVWQICKTHLLEGTLDQLALDEIGLAIELGYLNHEDVLSVLEQRPSAMDVIVTGPAIPAEMMEMADQVTELRRGF